MSSKGGQRRTASVMCGFSTRGSVREVEYKLKLHLRICEWCKENNKEIKKQIEETPFNATAGTYNGWDGIKTNGITKNKVCNVVVNGNPDVVISRGSTTVEQAISNIETQIIVNKTKLETYKSK